MKLSIKDIKLKHLNSITSDLIDYKFLMKDILAYKNTWLDKRLLFKWKFRKVYDIVKLIQNVEISTLGIDSQCKITMPQNIDALTYQARIEIDQVRLSNENIVDIIADVIALSCFQQIHKVKFNSDSQLFKNWREHILNLPLIDMIGLYNEIEKKLDESNKTWKILFEQVRVDDPDYEIVDGHAYLGRFNLLNIIKKMMSEFNVSYTEAFLLEYRLIQTNSLEAASKSYVGDQMRMHKERVFKAQRATQK